ncbi:MAG: aminopeptidase P family protein [Chloroflexi bacterium]|nr:aminopeptidase P family protein [Chloroflexota bacterium]
MSEKWFNRPYTAKERDRRWQKMRELMQNNELDALLVLGTGAAGADTYITNWSPGNTVLFPLQGEPLMMTSGLGGMLAIKGELPKEERPWIKDVRTGARGAMIVAELKEKGLEKGRVGVVGLRSTGAVNPEAGVSYATWFRVVNRLPECKLEDVAEAFDETMVVKSEEETAHIRHAAEVLEKVSEALLKAMRPGVGENEVWAAIGKAELDLGVAPSVTQFGSGPNTIGGRSLWLSGIGVPRILQRGDVLVTELTAWSKDQNVQVQMCAAIPPVSPEVQECARLARECYEAGVRVLHPGRKFEEVAAATEVPIEKHPTAWFQTPQLHSLNPHICVGRTGVNIQRMPGVENFPQVGTGRIRGGETVLKPGMAFELEPNACIGLNRVLIGGTVLVTEKGPEELNEIPCRMRLAE